MWVECGMIGQFVDRLFLKPAEVIDEVNTWTKLHTNGVIEHILSHDSIETIRGSTLILANAVYFKNAWSEKFDAKLTKYNYFKLLDGTSVKVPFMTSHKDQYLRGYDGFQVLRLPYVEDQRQFSMYIYLSNDKDGLPTIYWAMLILLRLCKFGLG
ncbi:unnamed protein product [Arabis nemorensis]|uniref:Serpin domain-containing protein n=1 Tax=Arabis nemorensis TaxID=586526 RepID=A0A565BUN4_9BRAS|nr:unnamed protein product [Arabis nemorensis]